MSDIVGYISSFFVTFGLGVGFVIGGLIFIFALAYAFMLIFKRTRLAIKEDRSKAFIPVRSRLAPVRNSHKRPNPAGNQSR